MLLFTVSALKDALKKTHFQSLDGVCLTTLELLKKVTCIAVKGDESQIYVVYIKSQVSLKFRY